MSLLVKIAVIVAVVLAEGLEIVVVGLRTQGRPVVLMALILSAMASVGVVGFVLFFILG